MTCVVVLIVSRSPLFATAIAFRISNQNEAAVAADSRRTYVYFDGRRPSEIYDDTCKICRTRLGIFTYTELDPASGSCDLAKNITSDPSITLADAVERIVDAVIPIYRRPAEYAIGSPNFSEFTKFSEIALIGFQNGRIEYALTTMKARQVGGRVVIDVGPPPSMNLPRILNCPTRCLPIYAMGTEAAHAILDTDRQNLLQMPLVDSVRELVRRAADRDKTVGGPISVVTIGPRGLSTVDQGVCPAEPKQVPKK